MNLCLSSFCRAVFIRLKMVISLGCVFSGGLSLNLFAQEFSIEEVRLLQDGRVEVVFPSQMENYYRLLTGFEVNSVEIPAGVGLGSPLRSEEPVVGSVRFFRVQRLLRSNALDTDGDGVDDVAELLQGTSPLVRNGIPERVTRLSSSPGNGESDIAVTRETILRFSRPLMEGLSIVDNVVEATFGQRKLMTRLELSADRRTLTLFYLEPIPASSQIRVLVDGNRLIDGAGLAVDGDGDGEPGGLGMIEFETLSVSAVSGTGVIGRVFASELVNGQAVNRPLEGVVVTVDGAESTLRTVTDGEGNFLLQPVPAGTFFVRVDGRSAVGSQWPDGEYYPMVGKAWEAVAGKMDNLASGTGEIFLPKVRVGTLQSVSPSETTVIEFPAAVVAENPDLAGVRIQVPPNALYSDDGARGGRVGIAPVSPDRLPEPLPDGLNFPLVITVQTDGASNFDRPVPVIFPNLPDPTTGERLPPGAKTALWSFDHDIGSWVIQGSMTVSSDGRFVESDPGVGIREPGWHGVQPGTSVEGGEIEAECEETGCIMGPILVHRLTGGRVRFELEPEAHTPGIVNWFAAGASNAQGLSGNVVEFNFCEAGQYSVTAQVTPKCGDFCSKTVSITILEEDLQSQCDPGFLTLLPPEVVQRGESIRLSLIFNTTEPVNPLDFRWEAIGANPSSGRGLTFTTAFCQTGPHRIKWSRQNGCGPLCSDEVMVNVEDQPISITPIQFGSGATAPLRESIRNVVLLTSQTSSGGFAFWEFPGASVVNALSKGQFHEVTDGSKVTVQALRYERPGNYTVKVRFENRCGESREESISFEIFEPPCELSDFVMTIGDRANLKAGDLVSLGSSVSGPGTVTWDVPGAIQNELTDGIGGPPEQVIRSNDLFFTTSQAFLVPSPGSYTISAFFTTVGGQMCTKSITLNVNAAASPALSAEEQFRLLNPDTLRELAEYRGVSWEDDDSDFSVAQELDGNSGSGMGGATGGVVSRQKGLHYYVIENVVTGAVVRRGVAGKNGIAHARPLILGADRRYREVILQAETFWVGAQEFVTGENGSQLVLGAFRLEAPSSMDRDGDGLSDEAEFVVGTNPDLADTDGDGIRDGEEVRSGTALSESLGVIASVQLDGYAADLSVDQDRLALSNREGGVSVFNVFNGLAPALIAQLELPGTSTSVALEKDWVLVGCEQAGAYLVDIGDPASAFVRAHASFETSVRSVAIRDGLGFVGTDSGQVALMDLASGTISARMFLNGQVHDLVARGKWIYALTSSELVVLSVSEGSGLQFIGSVSSPGVVGAGGRRLRLFVGEGFAYALDTSGFRVFELGDLGLPNFLVRQDTLQFGWKRLVPTGTGLAIAAVDANSTDDGPHDVALYDLGSNNLEANFLDTFPTPGLAEAVVVSSGLAYVADGEAGLQVIRFVARDRNLQAPEIELESPFSDGSAEEGKSASFTARVNDDVMVSRVEFFLDGERVGVDTSYPFEATLDLPERSVNRQSVTVQAQAFDTGGNTAVSDLLVLNLITDASAPEIVRVSPGFFVTTEGGPVDRLSVTFNEAILDSSAGRERLEVVAAGPDRSIGSEDDVAIEGGTLVYISETSTLLLLLEGLLPQGPVQVSLLPGVEDLNGNVRTSSFSWSFTVGAPRVIESTPSFGQTSSGKSVSVRFNGPIVPESLTGQFTVSGVGPDGVGGTADDVLVTGGTVRYEDTTFTATMAFSELLAVGSYSGRMDVGVRDAAGNSLESPFRWDFRVLQGEVLEGQPFRLPFSLNGSNQGMEVLLRLPAGRPISFFAPSSFEGCPEFALRGPDGEVLFETSSLCRRPEVVTLSVAGEYVLSARTLGNGFGSYNLIVGILTERRFSANLIGQQLLEQASGMRTVGDVDYWDITFGPGEAFAFNLSGFSDAFLTLKDRSGNVLFSGESGLGRFLRMETGAGGLFQLEVVAARESGYELRIIQLQDRIFEVDLRNGETYEQSESLDIPGLVDIYRFQMNPDSDYRFLGSRFGNCLPWELRGPNGQILFNGESCDVQERPDLSEGGVYELRLTSTENQSGQYDFAVARPSTTRFPIDLAQSPGDFVSRDLLVAGSRHIYELSANENTQLFLNVTPATFGGGGGGALGLQNFGGQDGKGILWSLAHEGGAEIVPLRAAFAGDHFVRLTVGGVYFLTVTTSDSPETTGYLLEWNTVRSEDGQWLPVPLDGGPVGPTTAVAVMGEDVFVAGRFAEGVGVGRFRNGVWQFLGPALRDGSSEVEISTLYVDGEDLYAGGNFTELGGAGIRGIALWNGSEWEALGDGIATSANDNFAFQVRSIIRFNGDLLVGGRFRMAGNVSAKNIARWDGSQWHACPLRFPIFSLTQGIGGRPDNDVSEMVYGLAEVQGALWIGGEFQAPGRNIALWNGTSIDGGPGLTQSSFDGGAVFGLAEQNGNLIAVGRFRQAAFGGNLNSDGIGSWDGTRWNGVGGGVGFNPPQAVLVNGDGIVVGGEFRQTGLTSENGTRVNAIGRFDGSVWKTFQAGVLREGGNGVISGIVRGMASSGNRIYVIGFLNQTDQVEVPHFGIWEKAE